MPPQKFAYITGEVLLWARKQAGWDIDTIARKIKVDPVKIANWEQEKEFPTLSQLRRLAKQYRVSITVFYLPSPPNINIKLPRDYRRLVGTTIHSFPPELLLLMRSLHERRAQYIEVIKELNQTAPDKLEMLDMQLPASEAGAHIRRIIGLTKELQSKWSDDRIAFNSLRALVENSGALVFQFTEKSIKVENVRGFSFPDKPLPIIAINRKDSYVARTFTLVHEFTHVLLRSSGVCNVLDDTGLPPEDLALEIYCNAVAAETLVPAKDLIAIASTFSSKSNPSDEEIRNAALQFGVSREVIVRRLLTLGYVNQVFYAYKRKQYTPVVAKVKKGGGPKPTVNAISLLGSTFVKAVIEAVSTQRITVSDASDYLGLKTKHIPKLYELMTQPGV